MTAERRKSMAVWKLASCDGCQLSILDLEDELLSLAQQIDFEYFLEASSRHGEGPFDLSLVEGSVTTLDDIERLKTIRQRSRVLVTIGACATAGGIQALRNFAEVKEFISTVYARPEYIKTLSHSEAVKEHVRVDYELRGCPIDKHQLLEVITAYLHGRRPNIRELSVCVECKASGTACIAVFKGVSCMGPVTQAGCGAICPRYGRGCYGCFGPKERANTAALAKDMARKGLARSDIRNVYRTFNAWSADFRKESLAHDDENH